jgi:hypothetical protein
MNTFLDQASHNEEFHTSLCETFNDKFYDWKITALFYCSIHYLKALAASRGIDIGSTHQEIENNVNPDKKYNKMAIKRWAWIEYRNLYKYSRTARYEGMKTDRETFEKLKKTDYDFSKVHLEQFKKYIQSQGVDLGIEYTSDN